MSEKTSSLERMIDGHDLKMVIDDLFDDKYQDYVVTGEPWQTSEGITKSSEQLYLAEDSHRQTYRHIWDVPQIKLERVTTTDKDGSATKKYQWGDHTLGFAESGLVWDRFRGLEWDYIRGGNEDYMFVDELSILKPRDIRSYYDRIVSPGIQPISVVQDQIDEANRRRISSRISQAFTALRPNNL